jgi:hypothetical protein
VAATFLAISGSNLFAITLSRRVVEPLKICNSHSEIQQSDRDFDVATGAQFAIWIALCVHLEATGEMAKAQ